MATKYLFSCLIGNNYIGFLALYENESEKCSLALWSITFETTNVNEKTDKGDNMESQRCQHQHE